MRTRFNKNIESYRSERFDLDKEAMWTEIDLRINKRSKRQNERNASNAF